MATTGTRCRSLGIGGFAALCRLVLILSLSSFPVAVLPDGDEKEKKEEQTEKAAAAKVGEEEKDEEGKRNEERITEDQLPAPVCVTLDRERLGGEVKEIVKGTDDGKVVFEVKVMIEGTPYEIKIADSGTLIAKKPDEEKAEGQEGKAKAAKENPEEESEEMEEAAGPGEAWTFDAEKPDALPPAWQITETKGAGLFASWLVLADPMAPSKPNVLSVKANNPNQVFNVLLATGTSYKDLTLSVNLKAVGGKEDQGGGLIWRARDANNYYIARWNPLENNIRLYSVKGGQRTMLKSAEVKTDPTAWHKIKVVQIGNRIRVDLGEKPYLEAEDSTFADAGMIGLWTKADASSQFDDLKAQAIKAKRQLGKEDKKAKESKEGMEKEEKDNDDD